MSKYYPTFKCLLCGDMIHNDNHPVELSDEQRPQIQIHTITRYYREKHNEIQLYSPFINHECKDGSVGIAEFAGFKIAKQ